MKNRFDELNNPSLKAFALDLFVRFFKSLPLCYKLKGKVIPFAFLNTFFSWFKIAREEKKIILKIWEMENLCKIHHFHGISLNHDSLSERDKIYSKLREEVQKILEGEKKNE